jgi:hypothetical protein
MCRFQGHTAAGNITSMKNANDIIENRTRDIPAGSAFPPPIAPSHVNQIHQTVERKTERPPTVSYLKLIGTF